MAVVHHMQQLWKQYLLPLRGRQCSSSWPTGVQMQAFHLPLKKVPAQGLFKGPDHFTFPYYPAHHNANHLSPTGIPQIVVEADLPTKYPCMPSGLHPKHGGVNAG